MSEPVVPRNPFYRQLDFYNPKNPRLQPRITVIGAGGIGSWTVLQLAKLGIRSITVYDKDKVETHNLSTTPYVKKHIGKSKAKALAKLAETNGYSHTRIKAIPEWFKGEMLPPTDILISAVDSLEARKEIYKAALVQKIPVVIDGRIGGENIRVYTVRTDSEEDHAVYTASLSPPTLLPLPCTAQQVIDVGWTTASLITRAVRQITSSGRYNQEVVVKVDTLDILVTPQKGESEEHGNNS